MGLSQTRLMAKLIEHYGGFCFDKNAQQRVFCPESLLLFLQDRSHAFENYWNKGAAQPSALMKHIVKRKLQKPLDFSQTVLMDPSGVLPKNYELMNPDALLLQTGNLTIRSADPVTGVLLLGYPNREVSASMANVYAQVITGKPADVSLPLLTYLNAGEIAEAVGYINHFLNSLNDQYYLLRDEFSLQAFIQMLLIGMTFRPNIEVPTARGHRDLEVDVGENH